MPTKQCTKCKQIKELEEFHKDNNNKKDGRNSLCKSCISARQKARGLLPLPPSPPIKECCVCHIGKPPSEFYINPRAKDGLTSSCNPCRKIRDDLVREARRVKLFGLPKTGNKVCRNCKIDKLAENFNRSSSYPDGISNLCVDCDKEYKEKRKTRELDIIPSETLKRCTGCSLDKKIVEFNKNFNAKNGIRSRCRDCENEERFQREYGIGWAEYNSMMEGQNGTCKICRKPECMVVRGKVLPLSVDHCHRTGKIRGLLCRKCNTAIGLLGDNPEIADSARLYLTI